MFDIMALLCLILLNVCYNGFSICYTLNMSVIMAFLSVICVNACYNGFAICYHVKCFL